MTFPSIFDPLVVRQITARITSLTHQTQPEWGKMDVARMLAHLCVSYEMVFEDKHKAPGALLKVFLKLFVKSSVVGPKPYPKNLRTAPAFLITDKRVFETEQKRLLAFLNRTCELGEAHFDGHASMSFGALSADEWNTLFYKHLDHHLRQFGV